MDPGSPLRSGRGDAEGKPGGILHESQTGAAGITRPFPCMPFATSSVDCNHLVEAAERVGSLVAEAMAGHAALR